MTVIAPVETGFGLAEDQAIKAKVSGFTLPNDKGGPIEVPVRFRYPEGEFNPQGVATSPSGIQYPLITIDQTTVLYDRKRDHVNNVEITYVPDMTPELPDPTRPGITEYPTPVRIGYQITTWTRSAQHNVMLRAALLHPDRLPIRHGWLYVAADDHWREMESMGIRSDNFIDGQKRRIFRSIFTVFVEAELLKTEIVQLPLVEEVILDPPTNVPDHMQGVH